MNIKIKDDPIPMAVDAGATPLINSRHTYDTNWSKLFTPPIKPTITKFQTYTVEVKSVEGKLMCKLGIRIKSHSSHCSCSQEIDPVILDTTA